MSEHRTKESGKERGRPGQVVGRIGQSENLVVVQPEKKAEDWQRLAESEAARANRLHELLREEREVNRALLIELQEAQHPE